MNKMLECPSENENLIDNYVFGKLTPAEMDHFEEHYFNCQSCTEAVKIRGKVVRALEKKPQDLYNPEKFPSIKIAPNIIAEKGNQIPLLGSNSFFTQARLFYMAAAVLAIFFIVRAIQPSSNIAQGSTIAENDISLLAEAYGNSYKTIPRLEQQVNNDQRSAFSVKILSPHPNATINREFRFYWQIDVSWESDKIEFYILNNVEEIIFKSSPQNHEVIFNQQLSPGLYYWILETSEETIYTDRFVVFPNPQNIEN